MKRIITFLILASSSLFLIGQGNEIYRANIPGYRENDTIRLDDLLKMKDIFTINSNCQVTGFVLVYNYTNYDFMMISKSNSLTEDMKSRLLKFRGMKVKILKITFKAITILTPKKEEIKVRALKYILKIS